MGLFDAIGSIFTTERTNRSNERSQQAANDLNAALTRETNAANLAIARETNAANKALWEEQTAYNAPEAQMKRLEAAGLNPNLVYGQIAESRASSPPAMQSADMAAPSVEPTRYDYSLKPMGDNPIAEYQQTKNLQALNGLTNMKIEQVKADAESSVAESKYNKWKFKFMEDNKMLSNNPIMNIGNRGLDLLDYMGKWIGSGAANVTLQREAERR